MNTLTGALAAALRAIAIEHGVIQPDGNSSPDLSGVRRGSASDAARAALTAYDAHATALARCGDTPAGDDVPHTQEPWQCMVDKGEPNRSVLLRPDGDWLISLLHNGELMPEKQQADLRRIVACVNACAGIPIQALEGATFAPADDETPIYELVSAHAH